MPPSYFLSFYSPKMNIYVVITARGNVRGNRLLFFSGCTFNCFKQLISPLPFPIHPILPIGNIWSPRPFNPPDWSLPERTVAFQNTDLWALPWRPRVTASPSNAWGVSLSPGRGAEITHAPTPNNTLKKKKKQYCNKFKRILKWFTSNKSLKHTHRKKTKLSLSRDQTEQGNIFHAAAVTWIHLKTDFRVPAILHFKLEYFQMTNHISMSMSFHSCRTTKAHFSSLPTFPEY